MQGDPIPGGQVPNPAFAAAGTAAATAAAGIPASISNPGYVGSTHAETNHKLMCYFLRYHRSTSYDTEVTEFRQPIQVQSHLEMPGILVQLGHIQRT